MLCLGLGFIPFNPSIKRETRSATERLIRGINTRISFFNSNKTNIKGWLTKHIQSEWTPEEQTWQTDDEVILILEKLSNPARNRNPVIHEGIPSLLKQLQNRKDIHVLKSDKGRNTVIWQVTEYDREALRQLSDTTTYKELSRTEFNNELHRLKTDCCTLSEQLYALGYLTENEDSAICERELQGSNIYFLPKVHKEMEKTSQTFPGRPIVATYTSIPYLLDKYITDITSHLLPKIPGSVVDTQHFLTLLPTSKLPENTFLVTSDVSSLYPNIPWKEGILATTEFYRNNFDSLTETAHRLKFRKPPSPTIFQQILTLIITNSFIVFKNKRYFLQIKGTAMGCCISVFFANCYMYYVTKPLLTNSPPWLSTFLRFIDDLFFIITTDDPTKFTEILETISNDHIRYESSPLALKQNFLDITVFLENNFLQFSPYTKQTASGSYLHPHSSHPHHVRNAIPYSQFLRIKRNSSTIPIFKRAIKPMIRNFRNLRYTNNILSSALNRLLQTDSEEADLPLKLVPLSFKFITNFNPSFNWNDIRKDLKTLHQLIINHYSLENGTENTAFIEWLQTTPISLIFSNEKTIESYFSPSTKK